MYIPHCGHLIRRNSGTLAASIFTPSAGKLRQIGQLFGSGSCATSVSFSHQGLDSIVEVLCCVPDSRHHPPQGSVAFRTPDALTGAEHRASAADGNPSIPALDITPLCPSSKCPRPCSPPGARSPPTVGWSAGRKGSYLQCSWPGAHRPGQLGSLEQRGSQ